MDLKINDTELGNLEIKNKAEAEKLNAAIKAQQEKMKNSLLTKKAPEKVIPKKEGHRHIVATF